MVNMVIMYCFSSFHINRSSICQSAYVWQYRQCTDDYVNTLLSQWSNHRENNSRVVVLEWTVGGAGLRMDRKGGATFSWYEKVRVWGGASFQNCQAKQKISTAWSSGQYCFASMLKIQFLLKFLPK